MSAQSVIESSQLNRSEQTPKDYIPKQLDYRQRNAQGSYYKYANRNRQNGSTNLVLSLATSTEVVFDVCMHPENLSKSTIDFDMILPAQGGGAFLNYFVHAPPFESVALRQKGGNDIVRIEDFRAFWLTTCLASKSFEKYIENGPPGIGIDIATARGNLCNYLNPTNNTGNLLTNVPSAHYVLNTGLGSAANDASRRPNDSLCTVISTGANVASAIHASILLGDIAESIFSVDKDLYSVEGLELVVTFVSAQTIGFTNATVLGHYNDTPADLTVLPTISELRMRVAQEQNPEAIRAVKQLVHTSGMKLLIPHPTVRRYNLTNATSASYQIRVNSGLGRNLLRIYTAERIAANNLNNRNNFYNLNGIEVIRFKTFLDGNPLQNNELDCRLGDNYKYMKPLLKDSVLGMNLHEYSLVPIWVDDFSGIPQLTKGSEYNLMDAGIKLDRELLYTKNYLQKAAHNHDVVAVVVTQRMFHSGPEGVAVTI